jgi:hypothetical protein
LLGKFAFFVAKRHGVPRNAVNQVLLRTDF